MKIIIKKSNPYSYLNNQASISEMLKEAIMVLFLPVVCSDEEEAPAQLELFVKKYHLLNDFTFRSSDYL